MTESPAPIDLDATRAMGRFLISALLDLAGLTCVAVGFWWLQPWCGMVALGLGLFVIALVIEPPSGRGGELTMVQEEELVDPAAPPPPGLNWSPNR
jgi:hypothetical protein